jgi:hypothetical protein
LIAQNRHPEEEVIQVQRQVECCHGKDADISLMDEFSTSRFFRVRSICSCVFNGVSFALIHMLIPYGYSSLGEFVGMREFHVLKIVHVWFWCDGFYLVFG